MGWTSLDSRIEHCRVMIGENLDTACQLISDLIQHTSSPSKRVRLWGLKVIVNCRIGDLDGGLLAYEEGRRMGGSAAARAELEKDAAELFILRHDEDAARNAAESALKLLHPLVLIPVGTSYGARRTARQNRAAYAAAWIMLAETAIHFGGNPSSLKEAWRAALEALKWADAKEAPLVHLSAISAVSFLMTRIGSVKDVVKALELVRRADKHLQRRGVPSRHPHRVKLRGLRALALVRLGSVDLGEHLLWRVLDELRNLGLDRDVEFAAKQLLWIVEERAGQSDRAKYLRRSLGVEMRESPKESGTDMGDPIGF